MSVLSSDALVMSANMDRSQLSRTPAPGLGLGCPGCSLGQHRASPAQGGRPDSWLSSSTDVLRMSSPQHGSANMSKSLLDGGASPHGLFCLPPNVSKLGSSLSISMVVSSSTESISSGRGAPFRIAALTTSSIEPDVHEASRSARDLLFTLKTSSPPARGGAATALPRGHPRDSITLPTTWPKVPETHEDSRSVRALHRASAMRPSSASTPRGPAAIVGPG
mmetsp:Transcript_100177/g.283658  ORF Transcript_100177/g.283658 Transcript_100177/m.283658 type:complete len:221 (-) Transcript_100177:111-773(-)